MTRRCKWCIARIGSARVFADGEWRKWDGSISPFHNVPPPPFTDGICPECFAAETAAIEAMPPPPKRGNWGGFVASLLLFAATIACRASVDAGKLADAIYLAEGGKKARVPYGVLSVKVKDEADARRICLNSIRNNQKRFGDVSDAEFIRRMADRWTPPSADPKGNANWRKNVDFFYFKK